MRGILWGGATAVLMLVLPAPGGEARAQEITAVAGAASYDLSGVGTSWTAAAR